MNVEIRPGRPAAAIVDDPAVLPSGLKVGAYDDMTDSPADVVSWPRLGEILTLCRDTVEAAYHRADRAALRNQRRHRLITLSAGFVPEAWPMWVEVVAAATALVSVGLGLIAEQILESEHREWLRLMIDAEWFG